MQYLGHTLKNYLYQITLFYPATLHVGNYINDFSSMDSQALTYLESREIAPKEQCSWQG